MMPWKKLLAAAARPIMRGLGSESGRVPTGDAIALVRVLMYFVDLDLIV